MENFLFTAMNFIVYLVGSTFVGTGLALGSAKSNKNMLYSYRAAVIGTFVGGVLHYVAQLWILGMFLDWYLFS